MDSLFMFRDEDKRMDWKSLFVYNSVTKVVRLVGTPATRDQVAAIMWRRKANYRRWFSDQTRGHDQG